MVTYAGKHVKYRVYVNRMQAKKFCMFSGRGRHAFH